MQRISLCMLVVAIGGMNARIQADDLLIGVAAVDVTPTEPARLNGYGNRRQPAQGVAQRLWVKALAIRGKEGPPAILITVDNLGVPATMTEEVARRLEQKIKLPKKRLVIAASHTHTAPCLTGVASCLFGEAIPDDHQAVIDRYTKRLTDQIEQVAIDAHANLEPGTLAWGQGSVGFAANRRVLKDGTWAGFGVNPMGPVQHVSPVMKAATTGGEVKAVVVNYACHCTTLGGDSNQVCGDWAGYAQEAIEREFPGAVGMVTIGCGADANPEPRGELAMARAHGETLAAEVKRVLQAELVPLETVPVCQATLIDLPFAPPPSRQELLERASQLGATGYHARVQLERLDAGEDLPASIPYPVQTWLFGDELAMVFLAGEVVVDYDLRLRWELDGKRLWITAYANDAPCYIASRRLLDEGGYEVDRSMQYYNQPGRLAPEAEERILRAVHDQLPEAYDPPES
ncbi:neutral/alkaline non-lysosomal ceramidase N-terminal domain-containing protein [Novipirellula artificiosorum]|uniref:Neutral ceramidase n=1 Tax=Novipirellula artificiosorum TaxID=2528016 RepID=A0A5C6D2X6_9BACT|nr:neutral/alkaline non-lysosomal ceramidase N-terminal domain-containing protein [Novipirellula artificiosorum]TWU31190.1 Neutral ceramidase [Novipirellula artificiosorum]